MAVRYAVASGNWNGPIWAASTTGVAGSAAAPTVGDIASLWKSGITVNVTSDVSAKMITVGGGTRLNIGMYTVNTVDTLTVLSGGTLDLGSGTYIVDQANSPDVYSSAITISDTATVIPGTSKMIFYHKQGLHYTFGNKTYNDVAIYLGNNSSLSSNISISSSPTFRSLTIQSKNTAAHTVNFNTDIIPVNKLVAIGSSTSNRLTLSGANYIQLADGGSSYGQFVNMQDISPVGPRLTAPSSPYIGSNSIQSGTSSGWLLQDPPKASTLVTEFTSLSGWQTQAVGSGYVNVSGGTLNMGWLGGSAYARITSLNTYDLVSDTAYLKVLNSTGGMFLTVQPVVSQGQTNLSEGTELLTSSERFWRISSTVSGDNATLTFAWYDNGSWVTTHTKTIPANQLRAVRLQIAGTRNINPATLVIDNIGYGPFPTQPIADFSASPTTGLRPVTINFTDLTKGIPDTWSWSFGDGYTSTQKNPSHPYSKAGTYTVSLTASNSVGTSTITKTDLIVVDPLVVSRETSGTLLFGGGSTRKLLAARTAGGGLVFGGETRAVLIRDAEALQDKMYLYKVYDPEGNFVEVWKDVMDEPTFTHEINTIGSTMTVQLARNSDTLGVTTSPLQTEAGTNILTQSDQTILVSTETRNQVGPSSSVYYNNRVDVTVFYGMVEPLYTEDMQPILTEDDETILAESGAPNGRRIFSGFISEINSRYGNTETTVVQLTSYGYDLDQYALTTAYDNMVTTVTFNSTDPSDIARTAMARFVQASTDQVTYTHATSGSIATTGTVVSYTFRNNTYKEVLDKVLELMPSNWYYYVDLGTNTVHFQQRSVTPQHLFYLGKHITALDLKGSILGAVNHTLFTGGGEPALYVERKEAPALRVRRGLDILSDSRVTIPLSAQIISDGKIEEGNKLQYRTTVEIVSKQYDIERITVGDTVGFRNTNSWIDQIVLQVVGRSYTADLVQLQLETKPATINRRIEDLRRNMTVSENQNTPSTPS